MLQKVMHHWFRLPFKLHIRYHVRPTSPKATILLLHGIGATGAYWQKTLPQLPDNAEVIVIDLLGFGESPKPSWAKYDAKTQATAVMRTLARMRLPKPHIIVGHSLGALIAIELAARHSRLAHQLILVAPPLYSSRETGARQVRTDNILRSIYGLMQSYPKQFVIVARMLLGTKLLNPSLSVSNDSVTVFMSVLRASIVNQTSLRDVARLSLPIHIIRGAYDPFLVPANIKKLARDCPNIQLTTLAASHELNRHMASTIARTVSDALKLP